MVRLRRAHKWRRGNSRSLQYLCAHEMFYYAGWAADCYAGFHNLGGVQLARTRDLWANRAHDLPANPATH